MKLLAPKVRPIEHGCPAFGDQFAEYAKHADRICITTGYISTDSILFLKENIELGRLPNTDLTVGMYADDGLRQGQYNACRLLAETLETTGLLCCASECGGN